MEPFQFPTKIGTLSDAGYQRAGFESFSKPGDILSNAIEADKATYNSLGTVTAAALNFIAVGSSAHGSLGDDYYFQNYYEQNLYHQSLDRGEFPVYRGYKLDAESRLRREVIKLIRTYFTVDFASIEATHKIQFKQHFAAELKTLEEFESDGIVKILDDGIELSELGHHFAPQVCSVFDGHLDWDHYNAKIPTNLKD